MGGVTAATPEADARIALDCLRSSLWGLLPPDEADTCFLAFLVATGNLHRPCVPEIFVAKQWRKPFRGARHRFVPNSDVLGTLIDQLSPRRVLELVSRNLPRFEQMELLSRQTPGGPPQ
jgi:hypothetical protein